MRNCQRIVAHKDRERRRPQCARTSERGEGLFPVKKCGKNIAYCCLRKLGAFVNAHHDVHALYCSSRRAFAEIVKLRCN